MAIATAVQRGGTVYGYNAAGTQILSKQGTLHGFTPDFLSVRIGNQIHVYDEGGNERFSKPTG